jgi:NTE family protein
MKIVTVVSFLFLIFTPLMSVADISTVASSKKDRSKIGLVLSGGGARGAAHVGVIRRLEELRIPIDYIAGTSMGSIIGGMYASGLSLDEIESVMTDIDWTNSFDDDTKRKDRTFRRKLDDKLYLFELKPGLSDEGEIKLPTGLLQGQKINLILSKISLPVAGIHDFDELSIPYRAVASDMVTGEAVVLGKGDLPKAMRASMNIPSAFAPLKYEDKLLVDGGIANNLPINVVRDMGADIVIAVDISTPLREKDDLDNVLKLTDQLIGIMTRTNTEVQIKTLTERDVFIVPDLGDIGTADFERVKEAVPIGYNAAQGKNSELEKLSIPADEYAMHLSRRGKPENKLPTIAFIRLENKSLLDDEVITSRINIKPGDQLDVAQLEEDIGKIHGLGLFENVNYEVVEEEGKTGVVVHAIEESWGPNYLQFGFVLSDNLEGDNSYNFGVAYTRTAMNRLNGEWRTALQVGEDPSIFTELYQPLDVEQKYFMNIGAFASHRNANVYRDVGEQLAEYRIKSGGLRLTGGMNFDTWGELRLGYTYESGSADARIGGPLLPDFDFDEASLFTRFSIDTRDNAFFPRHGQAGEFEYRDFKDSWGGDFDYEQLSIEYGLTKTWGKDTLIGAIRYETTADDDAPIQGLFQAGGLTNLSGFNQNELTGQHVGIAKLIYLRQISDFQFLETYVDNIWAGSVFLGLDTPIGPFYTGYGYAEGGHDSVYVYLGKLF